MSGACTRFTVGSECDGGRESSVGCGRRDVRMFRGSCLLTHREFSALMGVRRRDLAGDVAEMWSKEEHQS